MSMSRQIGLQLPLYPCTLSDTGGQSFCHKCLLISPKILNECSLKPLLMQFKATFNAVISLVFGSVSLNPHWAHIKDKCRHSHVFLPQSVVMLVCQLAFSQVFWNCVFVPWSVRLLLHDPNNCSSIWWSYHHHPHHYPQWKQVGAWET